MKEAWPTEATLTEDMSKVTEQYDLRKSSGGEIPLQTTEPSTEIGESFNHNHQELLDTDSDTAWRWVVVLGSHLAHQLVWGMIRSIGILLVEWKTYFDTGAAVTSSVASVMSAAMLLTGKGLDRVPGGTYMSIHFMQIWFIIINSSEVACPLWYTVTKKRRLTFQIIQVIIGLHPIIEHFY